MPDGTPFDIPADSPMPEPIDVPDTAAGQVTWLSMPIASPNTRAIVTGTALPTCRDMEAKLPKNSKSIGKV